MNVPSRDMDSARDQKTQAQPLTTSCNEIYYSNSESLLEKASSKVIERGKRVPALLVKVEPYVILSWLLRTDEKKTSRL